MIDINAVNDELSEIQRELSFHANCTSEYIVKYIGSYLRGSDLWILLEFMGGGSTLDLVRSAHTRPGQKTDGQREAAVCNQHG